MRGSGVRAAAALVLAGAACTGSAAPPTEDPATGAAMAEIVAALRVALPLSLSAERFSAAENQPALAASLAALRAGAHELESHGRSQDASFAYLSQSLARDAEDLKRRFDAGRTEEARFLLGALVDDCVGCHSRLPSEADSGLGRSLSEAVDAGTLTPIERARLLVATRQFEAALDVYEALLLAPEARPAELDLERVPEDYLTVAIRVREDLPRARATLAALAARPDLPSYLATLLAQWIAACDALRDAIRAEALLPEAERVLDEGAVLARYGRDRAALIHQLVASSLLLRYVDDGPQSGPEAAHAYFLLGVTSLQSGRSWWLGEAERYLETAIRQAPGSDWAKRAYVFLEEQTLANYSGSGGVHVPPDVRQRLRELRELAAGESG
jgi:tetratricopeptide (TPR) repeat protein